MKKRYLYLALVTSITFAGCATVSDKEVEIKDAEVMQLVEQEGQLTENVDKEFEGEAYSQDGEKVICKTQKKNGSRIGSKRVCKTKAQWDRAKSSASSTLRGLTDPLGTR